jgi:hypothetical protein
MSQIDQSQSPDPNSSGRAVEQARPGYGRPSGPPAGTTAQVEQPTAPAGTIINGGEQGSVQPSPGSPAANNTGNVASEALLPNAEPFRRRWESVQVGFVDNPEQAVDDAEALVSSVMDELVLGFRAQRERLEADRSNGEEISTDELRDAFRRYRDFFERLLQV